MHQSMAAARVLPPFVQGRSKVTDACACPFASSLQTAYGTQLSDAEVDELFRDLDIKEHEVVDYKQLVLALTSGFTQLDWTA